MIISHVILFNYYNINNQAFSFDPYFKFNLVNKNSITITKKRTFPNYLSDNIHINAIIGENGTGKSTLLNALTEILSGKANFEYILILREESTFLHNSTIDGFKLNWCY